MSNVRFLLNGFTLDIKPEFRQFTLASQYAIGQVLATMETRTHEVVLECGSTQSGAPVFLLTVFNKKKKEVLQEQVERVTESTLGQILPLRSKLPFYLMIAIQTVTSLSTDDHAFNVINHTQKGEIN